MKPKKDLLKIMIIYSCIFLFLSSIIIFIMHKDGRSFVYYGDAFVQHFPSQIFISKYLNDIAKNGFYLFNFNIGLGQDVLSTYHYYGLTDPLSAIFLIKNLSPVTIYMVRIFLRIYLSGIAFIFMCAYFTEKKYCISIAFDAVLYTFSNYALSPGMMHPFFINAMILLPFMVIAVHKLVYKNKILLFVIVFAASLITNVYLSIILSVTAFFYAFICTIDIFLKNGLSNGIKVFGRGMFSYLLSFLISGIVTFPVVNSIITNSIRNIDSKVELPFIMAKNDIINFFYEFFRAPNSNNFALVGISIVVLVTLIDMFINKGNLKLKIISFFTLLLILSPKLHKLFGGFLYDNYRWYFIVTLLLSYIFVIRFESVVESQGYKKISICFTTLLIIGVYTYRTYLRYANNPNLMKIQSKIAFSNDIFPIVVAFALIAIILFFRNKNLKSSSIYVLMIVSVSVNMFIYAKQSSYSRAFVKNDILHERLVKYDKYKDILTDSSEFFRVDNPNTAENNYSDIFGYNSIPINYSIENKNFSLFNLEYKNTASIPITVVRGFDSRAILNSITSTKYYLSNSKIPFGYKKISDGLYENIYYLPFGFTYDKYVSYDDIRMLDVLKKQNILLEACIIDDADNKKSSLTDIKKLEDNYFRKSSLVDTKLDFKAFKASKDTKNTKQIIQNKNIIKNKKEDALILEYDAKLKGELYLRIDNQDVFKNNPHIFVTHNGEERYYDFISKHSNWYAGENQKLINIGYIDSGKNQLKIRIPNEGEFDLSKISLDLISLGNYETNIEKLKGNHLENVSMSKNGFTGEIENKESKLLFISIPFNDGWKAFVDGKETDIFRANTGFMAIKLDSGSHKVEFKYERPLQSIGVISTIIGILLFVSYIVFRKLNTKHGAFRKKESNKFFKS